MLFLDTHAMKGWAFNNLQSPPLFNDIILTMIINGIDDELKNPETFLVVLEKLHKKSIANPSLLHQSAVIGDWPLIKLLKNPDRVSHALTHLIQRPNFEFHPQKKIELNENGKTRDIMISPWPDRVILMALQNILSQKLEPHFPENLFSFRKKKGPLKAAQSLREFLANHKNTYVIQRDIQKFGDTIDRKILLNQLRKYLPMDANPLFNRLLVQAIAPMFTVNEGEMQQLKHGLPSGSPITPVLENLYLLPLDEMMVPNHNFFYARYGDDFIMVLSDPTLLPEKEKQMDSILKDLNLTISFSKKVDKAFTHSRTCHISWLGNSFYSDGKIDAKPKYSEQFQKDFKRIFSAFIEEIKNNSDRELMLTRGLNQFLDYRGNPRLTKLLLNRNSERTTKTLDFNIRRFLVRWMSKSFIWSKRRTWKWIRDHKVPSLNYQRRYLWRLDQK
jgi:hypothetical protein